MFEEFSKYLLARANFTADELNQIKAVCREIKINKGDFLLEAGTLWGYNAHVCRGLMHTFTIDPDGQRRTVSFGPQNYWVGDRESQLTGNPATYNVQALEDTWLLLITQNDFRMICRNIDSFNSLLNGIIQKNLLIIQKRIFDDMTLSDEEKYLNYLKKYGQAANRIPLHMVASYLNIPEEVVEKLQAKRL